ncbi:ATP-dependent Clp protease adapter ClpS [Shinella sp. AETb1-6]|uniref:ATP-dependent Clp protease adapter ClpS n=1 Tax=Shinella TaxID=323620 RepID=UPI00106EEA83|nr:MULTISPECIES: ATP-dependent Clp protease adapter ClpS [Shinella]MDP9590905.1 ATP-dependent Clp protease adaptor protein ClpS [Shinella zoogloeoides]MCD1263345.1 ATP-dependent Clp protease adapter ClpS [Shinella sumterensis]MXN49952.1 ATP-dependent Clp protease adapter ClpS [Shinella sp. AETb1-6]TFE99737.1 ATP-dependent Clp protease adaptor ClpS [Shinella sumterensis]WLS07755.1 ATP-dependent Clp protease adapter ClpS [Shinella sumterensis]
MSNGDTILDPKTTTKPRLERPKLYKVLLVNDDYTPREFVVLVLKAVFGMAEETSYRVMMTAHKMGTCVVVICARDIAETKAKEATDLAKEAGFPLLFQTEPEE